MRGLRFQRWISFGGLEYGDYFGVLGLRNEVASETKPYRKDANPMLWTWNRNRVLLWRVVGFNKLHIKCIGAKALRHDLSSRLCDF